MSQKTSISSLLKGVIAIFLPEIKVYEKKSTMEEIEKIT
jgi:uncharacterized membrane protein YqaE (UPF0057 family)